MSKTEIFDVRDFDLESYTLICPECFHSVHVKTEGKMVLDGLTDSPRPMRDYLYACCPHCKDKDGEHSVKMFACDDNLAGYIVNLNKHGYDTQFCCEGHVEVTDNGYAVSLPYIIFNGKTPSRRKIFHAATAIRRELPEFDGRIIMETDCHLTRFQEKNTPRKPSDIDRLSRLILTVDITKFNLDGNDLGSCQKRVNEMHDCYFRFMNALVARLN